MKSLSLTVTCVASLLATGLFSSCQQQVEPEQAPAEIVPVAKPSPYELFVKKHKKYPRTMEIYRDKELLGKAHPRCPIYICLSQQRGRLYVDNQVAADWPVSTGTGDHATPTGNFRVLEKKKSYSSRTWGRIYDANGKCVNRNADSRKDPIPEGGKFVGSPMPNWHRMTGTGIGMHTGKVRAGRTLSHGCIRTPSRMASELFDITATGKTRIIVTKEVEKCYPQFVGTAEKSTSERPAGSAAAATAPAPTAAAPVPARDELPPVVVEG